MPIYSLQHDESDEIVEKWSTYADLQSYLKENPSWKHIITKPPAMGDSARLGVTKTDDNFNSLLKYIGKRNKGSNIQTR